MSKLCKKCLKSKPIGEFYRHSMMADGHINKCKECTKADVIENRNANLEYYRQYDRKRYDEHGKRAQTIESKESRRERSKRWQSRNPEKRRCHLIVGNAVRSGKLRSPRKCSSCGKSGKTEAHHEDYSKPLSILWLCRKCHAAKNAKPRIKMKPRKRGGYVGSMKPSRAKGVTNPA